MNSDPLVAAGTALLIAGVSYFLGNRAAKVKSLQEQRARSANSLVKLIGEVLSIMRGEVAARRGDDFEQTQEHFNHLDFLSRLRAGFDVKRPYLTPQAVAAVELLIRNLRLHTRIQLGLTDGSFSPEEAATGGGLDGLMTVFIDAQTRIADSV